MDRFRSGRPTSNITRQTSNKKALAVVPPIPPNPAVQWTAYVGDVLLRRPAVNCGYTYSGRCGIFFTYHPSCITCTPSLQAGRLARTAPTTPRVPWSDRKPLHSSFITCTSLLQAGRLNRSAPTIPRGPWSDRKPPRPTSNKKALA